MSNTVKQSHLVPRCYLKNFATNDRISAFNKKTNKILHNQNISEVSTQNKFYDLTDNDLEELKRIIPNISKQHIEKYLSEKVEPALEAFFNRVSQIDFSGLLQRYNVSFTTEDKFNFNLFLVYQLFRTRKCRDILVKVLGKNDGERLQKNILLDTVALENVATKLQAFQWLLQINTTGVDYITSDNPVIIYDINMDGILSIPVPFRGSFQILYPITKKILLYISDIQIAGVDVNETFDCIEENSEFAVSFVNRLHYDNSFMFQYSSSSDCAVESFLPRSNFEINQSNLNDVNSINELNAELFQMMTSGNVDQDRVAEIEDRIKTLTDKYI